jgi:RNA polymerase sigma factor for flagellar operon FliA
MSRDTRSRLREVRNAVQRLEHQLGRAPRAKEVANELDWPLEKFHQCMVDAGAAGVRAGDEALDVADEFGASDDSEQHMAVDEHADPLRSLQQRQRHAALNAAFDALEEAERFVMEAIYDHGASLRDIGQTLGVSESRVSQMSSEIVAKLRRRLREW